MKYILVSGGVLSGLGKGIVTSSVGRIFIEMGYSVTAIKIDPYLNIDAGTMSPAEHGEVYVLGDGGEVDLDLGNYERYLNLELCRDNNITTGKIYKNVIDKERRGDYLGKTVQVIPHICDEIKERIKNVSEKSGAEICMIELGGTFGDIEGMPFVEALRQFQFSMGRENFCHIMVSLVPMLSSVGGEQKTKPTQQAIKEARSQGLFPDIIICRSQNKLSETARQKISIFAQLPTSSIIGLQDIINLYQVPKLLFEQGLDTILKNIMQLQPSSTLNSGDNKSPTELFSEYDSPWQRYCSAQDSISNCTTTKETTIAIVGKYIDSSDSYMSVIKALEHASVKVGAKLTKLWINATDLETNSNNAWTKLKSAQGILVPGGFGNRGVEGKILAIQYARENKVPYLGICIGFQLAAIEFARNVLGLADANSTEFNEQTNHAIVHIIPSDLEATTTTISGNCTTTKNDLGGTLFLGNQISLFAGDSKLKSLYGGASIIVERHRRRYEINKNYVDLLESAGLLFVGKDRSGEKQHMLELSNHSFFIALQAHPEFNSRPTKPSPPFVGFMRAARYI